MITTIVNHSKSYLTMVVTVHHSPSWGLHSHFVTSAVSGHRHRHHPRRERPCRGDWMWWRAWGLTEKMSTSCGWSITHQSIIIKELINPSLGHGKSSIFSWLILLKLDDLWTFIVDADEATSIIIFVGWIHGRNGDNIPKRVRVSWYVVELSTTVNHYQQLSTAVGHSTSQAANCAARLMQH